MRDLRSMRCIPLLCAVLAVSLVYTVDIESCNTPPCEATCAIVCSTPATTVKIDEINDFDVSLDVNISAAVDIDCGTANEIVIEFSSATQTDAFGDGTISFTAPTSLTIGATTTANLTVTFPADADPGLRTFDISFVGLYASVKCVKTCTISIYLATAVTIEDVSEFPCGLDGDPSQKVFKITNCTDEERILVFSITSLQTASSDGEIDHFPIALCGEPLPEGDPLSTEIPTIDSEVVVPAGVGECVFVCFNTASFPGCHPGSSCIYRLVGTDDTTGEEIGVGTEHTVVSPDWIGCTAPECLQPIEVCNEPNLDISADFDVTQDEIFVEGPGFVVDLDARIDITHTFIGDLQIFLTAPSSTQVALKLDGDSDLEDILAIFDDDGEAYNEFNLSPDPTSTDPVVMQPQGPGTMASFLAEDAEGPWVLSIFDVFLGDDGTLNEWCLDFDKPAPPGVLFIRGDADSNGDFFPIIDALYILENGFTGGPDPGCFDAADGDGNNIYFPLIDALYILANGFTGGPPPPAPHPDCGLDPDDDDLSCDVPSDGC